MYKGYLIDLDGTMYRGEEQIEEASDFVKALGERGIPYLFVTNNSTRKPEQVAESLFVSIFQRKQSKYSQRVWRLRTSFMNVNKTQLYI